MEDGVFVTNIKATIDQATLRTYFGQFGTVLDFNLQPDKFNEANKVCYIRFSTPEGASKCLKQDRSTHFGEPIKVALKKFTERNPNKIIENRNIESKPFEMKNGITRVQSFGRGRGAVQHSPGIPGISKDVQLKILELPLERKCTVEVVELKSLTNILVRPLQLTERFRSDLNELLVKHNKNADRLMPVKIPDINGFYMAKWTEDNNFYRAKILTKISDEKFEVCFVDEGTTGDIVSELMSIPDDLSNIPCLFVPCTADCKDSGELIDMVLKEGSDKEVSVCAISSIKFDGKYSVSIFIDDKNIVDIYKSKYSIDPRVEKIPNRSEIKSHIIDQQLSNCRVTKDPSEQGIFVITLNEAPELNPILQTLTTYPIGNDLLAYKDNNGDVHRCVVQAYKFDRDRLTFAVDLIDENRQINVTKDFLMRCSVTEINYVPSSIRAVMDGGSLPGSIDEVDSVILSDYDSKKNLYAMRIVDKKKSIKGGSVLSNGNIEKMDKSLIGVSMGALISHVETVNEFYVQLSDVTSMVGLEKIQSEINSSNFKPVKVGHVRELRVNQVVVAPFCDVNYRATVKEVDAGKNEVLCFFMDFGNSEWVAGNDVLRAQDSVARVSAMALRCQLPVSVIHDKIAAATDMLLEYCGRGELEVQVTVQAESGHGDARMLTVNVSVAKKSSFVEVVSAKGLVTAQDTELAKDDPRLRERVLRKLHDLEQRIARMEASVSRCK